MDTDAQDIKYLEKRLKLAVTENDLLRKENTTMRKELSMLKNTFTNIISEKRPQTGNSTTSEYFMIQFRRFQNESALKQVLEMQRSRIDLLEKELETLKQKYEKLLFQNKAQPYSQTQVDDECIKELYSLRQKNADLEESIKVIVSNQAKELAQYRSKVAQQDAQILTSSTKVTQKKSDMLQPIQKNYQVLNVSLKKFE